MNKPLRTSSAASLVVLASMIGGCAAPHAHAGMATHVGGKAADADVGLATRALIALNSNNAPLAIDLAERAVAKSPTDATVRALLGNSYFAGGRFRSAESAYRDALTVDANQPQVILKLALVQIAQGKNDAAASFLNRSRLQLDASDYGLALALAGRSAPAIAVLEAAARRTDADPTVRQNLALAYALAGDWTKARIVAGQDVPANQLDARIQQWMQLASPKHASDQVAALVGVTPAAVDAGQPVQLALNKEDPAVKIAALTAADATPADAPAMPVVEAAAPAPAPAPAPVVAVAPAPPPPRSTLATLAATAVSEAKSVLAAVLPHEAPQASKPRATATVQRAAVRHGSSKAVVQLGAYGSPQRVLAAWNNNARKYGALKAYAPMSARFASPKGVFYRLSVQGFNSVGEANALCASLRSKGGSCFVRNTAGDAPVQYASR